MISLVARRFLCVRTLSNMALAATYSQHLGLQKSPVLHAAGGVHVQQLAFDGGRVA